MFNKKTGCLLTLNGSEVHLSNVDALEVEDSEDVEENEDPTNFGQFNNM